MPKALDRFCFPLSFSFASSLFYPHVNRSAVFRQDVTSIIFILRATTVIYNCSPQSLSSPLYRVEEQAERFHRKKYVKLILTLIWQTWEKLNKAKGSVTSVAGSLSLSWNHLPSDFLSQSLQSAGLSYQVFVSSLSLSVFVVSEATRGEEESTLISSREATEPNKYPLKIFFFHSSSFIICLQGGWQSASAQLCHKTVELLPSKSLVKI